MSELDTMANVEKTLKDLREAATRVSVLSHILESNNPDKKNALLDIRTASERILERLEVVEATG